MSGVREKLLEKVRSLTEPLPDRTPLPSKETIDALRSRLVPEGHSEEALCEAFLQRWTEASGVVIDGAEGLKAFLEKEGVTCGYADPAVLELLGVSDLPGMVSEYDRKRVDELQYGITMGSAAVAESGTVVLTESGTPNRLAALAPWVHVAVVKRSEVVARLGDAIANFGTDPSIVFVTGPSKTADIEGILIEGVHGPGRQAVILV